MDERAGSVDPAAGWVKKNLVALGSVAVVSVYTAGYFRTEEAAARFAGESARRHAAPLAAPAGMQAQRAGEHGLPPRRSPEAAVINPSSLETAGPVAVKHANPASGPVATAARKPNDSPDSQVAAPTPARVTPQPAVQAAPQLALQHAAQPVPQPVIQPVVPAGTPPAPQPAPQLAPQLPPQPVAPVADSAAPAKTNKGGLRDGSYTGWGSSRHGDIQATVEVENGKITSAWISECRTQYSCSWISALPPEVLARQSAEVDYVSGATQSSNAFYYAVVQAISKAK
jgi:uncharacterized protein with FMN-binding domain